MSVRYRISASRTVSTRPGAITVIATMAMSWMPTTAHATVCEPVRGVKMAPFPFTLSLSLSLYISLISFPFTPCTYLPCPFFSSAFYLSSLVVFLCGLLLLFLVRFSLFCPIHAISWRVRRHFWRAIIMVWTSVCILPVWDRMPTMVPAWWMHLYELGTQAVCENQNAFRIPHCSDEDDLISKNQHTYDLKEKKQYGNCQSRTAYLLWCQRGECIYMRHARITPGSVYFNIIALFLRGRFDKLIQHTCGLKEKKWYNTHYIV